MAHTTYKRKVIYLLAALALMLSACSEDNDDSEAKTQQTEYDEDDDNTTAQVNDDYVYQLPVIFHVLYSDATDSSQYIPAARLQEILGYVNNLWEGDVYGLEFGTSVNTNVKFVLANYDESGQKLATPGVEYVKWTGTYPIDPSDFMSNKNYVSYLWEPNDYINVFMYNFKSDDESESETLGISHMPYALESDSALEGLTTLPTRYSSINKSNLSFPLCVSINSKYAWKNSAGLYYQSDRYTNSNHRMFVSSVTLGQVAMDVNVTLAHELGHYLGLFHTFSEPEDTESGEVADICVDTDYCSDTKTYNRAAYLEDVAEYLSASTGVVSAAYLMSRTDCDGEEFACSYIMDYSYTYGYEITAEELSRIRWVLYNSPLIPGPKTRAVTRAAKPIKGRLDLPFKVVK